MQERASNASNGSNQRPHPPNAHGPHLTNLAAHADALRAARGRADLPAVFDLAERACEALALGTTDAMIGLDEVDPALVDAVHDLAVEALDRCGAAGDARAWPLLGERWLEQGDRTRALAAFERAAEGGDDDAALHAARLVWTDRRAEHGPRAARWLARVAAARSSDGEPERLLGLLAWHGLDGRPADPARGHDHLARAAARGDVEAMFELHLFHAEVADDPDEAARWCVRAAEAGSPRAMTALGDRYAAAGDGERAADWYARAAERGHGRAAAALGLLLAQGSSRARARDWLARADRLGFDWTGLARAAGLDPARLSGAPRRKAKKKVRAAAKSKKSKSKKKKVGAR